MLARANITAWNREEDGSYEAHINEWKLHVFWTPEPPKGGPYGFKWKAEGPTGQKAGAEDFMEEAELAMMAAEAVAAPKDNPEGESDKG